MCAGTNKNPLEFLRSKNNEAGAAPIPVLAGSCSWRAEAKWQKKNLSDAFWYCGDALVLFGFNDTFRDPAALSFVLGGRCRGRRVISSSLAPVEDEEKGGGFSYANPAQADLPPMLSRAPG